MKFFHERAAMTSGVQQFVACTSDSGEKAVAVPLARSRKPLLTGKRKKKLASPKFFQVRCSKPKSVLRAWARADWQRKGRRESGTDGGTAPGWKELARLACCSWSLVRRGCRLLVVEPWRLVGSWLVLDFWWVSACRPRPRARCVLLWLWHWHAHPS